jgi:cytochrome b
MMSPVQTSLHVVYIWDVATRAFHWLLVACVTVALVTGFPAAENWMGVHRAAGYGVVCLLVFRLIWAFFGSEYSRLFAILRSARRAHSHIQGLMMLRPPHHLGHTPVGSIMIIALFLVLSALTITGLMVEGGEEKQGVFAAITSYRVGFAAKGIHGILALALMAMIAIHIVGVLVESWLQRVSLIRGMITGWLPLPENEPAPEIRPARPLHAMATMGAVLLPAAAVLFWLSGLPPYGIVTVEANAAHKTECGACHEPFHPSLLPRGSWHTIMANLGDHFGEDASLSAAAATEIANYLNEFSAEAWDTEVGNRFRIVSGENPLRITANPYWQAKHAEVPNTMFSTPPVSSKANCIACHSDSITGRFDDQKIKLPLPAKK